MLTDAERTSLLSSTPSQHRTEPIDPVERPQPGYADKDERGGSVGRWLIAVAVLAVLTVVVTVAINMFGGSTRDVQVPDVSGQASRRRDRRRCRTPASRRRPQQKPDSTVPPDHVIDTDPSADTSVGAGDEITLNVSTGPEQREVAGLSRT